MDRFASMTHDQLLAEAHRLDALINTAELVDFPKAVHLEAVHQEVRWGTTDREGKTPYDWHWLVFARCNAPGAVAVHHAQQRHGFVDVLAGLVVAGIPAGHGLPRAAVVQLKLNGPAHSSTA